jgi:hypothetical protein
VKQWNVSTWGVTQWGSLASIVSMGLLFYLNFRRPRAASEIVGANRRRGFGGPAQKTALLDFHTKAPIGMLTTYHDGHTWHWIATGKGGAPLGTGTADHLEAARRNASLQASKRLRGQ